MLNLKQTREILFAKSVKNIFEQSELISEAKINNVAFSLQVEYNADILEECAVIFYCCDGLLAQVDIGNILR